MNDTIQIRLGESCFNEIDAAIICLNEEHRILTTLTNIYDYFDGIVIVDGGSEDNTLQVIKNFPDPKNKIKLYKNKFTSFGDQKNLAISKTNSLWTFVIDADETLSEDLLKDLRILLRQQYDKDLIIIDRHNYIDDEKETNYIEKQYRLFKSFCRYVSIVHEELVGWRHELSVTLAPKYFIHHTKTKERYIDNQINFSSLQKLYPNKDSILARIIEYEIR